MANPTPEQIMAALEKADAAGDTEGAKQLAALYRQAISAAPAQHYPAGIQPQAGDVVVQPSAAYKAAAMQPSIDSSPLGSDTQNYLAGIGKSFVDTARGVGQRATEAVSSAFEPVRKIYTGLGLISKGSAADVALGAPQQASVALRQAEDEARQTDAPLMATKAGLAGNITGYGLQTLGPAAGLRGLRMAGIEPSAGLSEALIPTTTRSAALQGGAQGFVQPIGTQDTSATVAQNTGMGAITGAAMQAVPSAVGRLYQAGKAFAAPFTDAGLADILANVLRRYGAGGNFTPTASTVPGVQPSLAEATQNPGLALLQRTVQQNAPSVEGVVNAFANRDTANNAARVANLRAITGTDQDLTKAMASRSTETTPLYNQAKAADQQRIAQAQAQAVDQTAQAQKDAAQKAAELRAQGAVNPGSRAQFEQAAQAVENSVQPAQIPVHPGVQALMGRPAFQQAVKDASNLLAERGTPNVNPLTSIEGLQAVKTSLDNMTNYNPAGSFDKFDRNAVMDTRKALVQAMGDISPEQKAADAKFAELSGPVNAIQTGQEIARQSLSNAERGGVPTIRNEALARAINNADDIAKSQTGYQGATAQNTLGQSKIAQLQALSQDLNRANVGTTGALPKGQSPTGQNLVSQHILENLTGATGMPALAYNPAVQRASRAIGTIYKVFGIPDEIQAWLQDVFLNPTSPQARAVLAKIPPAQQGPLLQQLRPYFGAIGDAANAERLGQQQRAQSAGGQ